MKYMLLTFFLLGLNNSNAQNFDFHYDHYSFVVQDLKEVGFNQQCETLTQAYEF